MEFIPPCVMKAFRRGSAEIRIIFLFFTHIDRTKKNRDYFIFFIFNCIGFELNHHSIIY